MKQNREQIGMSRRSTSITVDIIARACVNCEFYEQYFRRGRGNMAVWTPTSTGYCLLHEERRGAMRQPCKEFERKA